MLGAALTGLVTGLSLIVAIGAQNAFVLRQGLARQHVGIVVAICAAADVALIVAGVAGIGRMNYLRFLVFSLIGAVAWVSICVSAGYYFGQFEFVNDTWLNNPKFAGLYDDADPLVAPSQPARVPQVDADQQGRNDEQMRDAFGARRAHFPGAYEQVEGEIVQPAGEEQPRRLEKPANVVERREAPLCASPEGSDQPRIGDRQKRRNGEACDAAAHPCPPGQQDEAGPAE